MLDLVVSPQGRRVRRRAADVARAFVVSEKRSDARARELLGLGPAREPWQVDASAELEYERPATRGDCIGGERPCPFVGCRYHLFLDVDPETGSLKLNFPGREIEAMAETCALDVADRGGATLEEVGEFTNVVRERIRQIEVRALMNLKRAPKVDELDPRWEPPPKDPT